MQNDLDLMLAGHTPLIAIETSDEARLLARLRKSAIAAPATEYRPLFRWTVTDGLQRLDIDLEPQPHNAKPEDVLRHIRAVRQPGTYVLLDFHPFLQDPVLVRLLKDICIGFAECRRYVVLAGHAVDVPDELRPFSGRAELALPDDSARERIVQRIAQEWVAEQSGRRVKTDREAFELLIQNLAGLSEADTERLARGAIYDDGVICERDLPLVTKAKYELLNRDSLLSYEYDTARFSDVGGLSKLKSWLHERRAAFLRADGAGHLDPPKGMLLIGVQGCGKSLAAKATAGVFGVPLLRLDFGSLYNKYHGETERNLREALKTASTLQPCVLWIDEIEKSLASGNDESGTSKRVLGAFLTWLAERREAVFVVATANDISALPAELVRKGRFDEIFFVDLPSENVRAEIVRLHLAARDHDPAGFDLAGLARRSEGFSGAELEQAIVSARYSAHARDESLSSRHIAAELARTRPLSVVMAEKVAALRRWAEGRAVPCD